MAARQKAWARRARSRLLEALGGACAWCGSSKGLTFDCVISQGDTHHRKDTSARMSFYHRQARAGNLQILCHACNSQKGNDGTNTELSSTQTNTVLGPVNIVNNVLNHSAEGSNHNEPW